MKKIRYVVKGDKSVTACPHGMTSFAGGAKIVGSLGCMNCVHHAGQSYTESGGVVSCLKESERVERARKAERPKRANKTDGANEPNGSNGRAKRVTKRETKKVSRNNNKKTKKEEKR